MPCPLHRILLLMCCGLAGCETAGPFIVLSDHPAGFDLNDPEVEQRVMTHLLSIQIADAPTGSLVDVVADFNRQYQGTLASTDRNEVHLVNCLCKEIAPSRQGKGQLKLSHVPFASLKIASMKNFYLVSPPPSQLESSMLSQHRGDSTVQAIVLRSGRHLPWIDPPAPISTQNVDLNEVSDQIAAALPGSHVSLVDENGQRVNGIVVSAGPEELELMNCLTREKLPAADGPAQFKTSHLSFQQFQPSSLESFAIVSPPPPDFSIPEVGVDCEEYIVSEFVFESGRRQAWGRPANATNPVESRVSWLSGFRNR